jgi:SAM-dependent methyltransferase
MKEELFQQAEEYNRLLNQGLSLSGEDKLFFARGRIAALRKCLPDADRVRCVLDFGCGIGDTTVLLAEAFPKARIIGVDNAAEVIEFANDRFGTDQLSFATNEQLPPRFRADLCYTNGVFHHIMPPDRPAALRFIHDALGPGSHFALFENNPLNPGTRLLMKRIPFDRNARLITPWLGRLLRDHGFGIAATKYLFFFPHMLRALRCLEPCLSWMPIGAQYLILSRKQSGGAATHDAIETDAAATQASANDAATTIAVRGKGPRIAETSLK